MSTGRFLMLCTVFLHVAGLALSFLYGEIIVAWIGGKLVYLAGLGISIVFRHNSFPYGRLPYHMLHTFLDHSGLIWLCLALVIQLSYLPRYLRRQMKKRDLGASYAGTPGGQYWENIQRNFKDYRQAILRWEPKIALRTPTWYYYKRLESSQPDLFWRGYKLVIEKDLLKPEHAQELAPLLARELMYYNCDDVTFKVILAFYPDRFSRWQVVLHLLGLCYFLPVMLMLWYFWPRYWEQRILVADKFAYYLGQGHLLYLYIQMQLQQEEQDKQKRRAITREIQKLQEQKRAKKNDYDLPSFSNEDSKQLDHQIKSLQQWEQYFLQKEQQAIEVHPMVEQRREQLVALLGTEQTWMEQHGITPPVQAASLSTIQEPRRLQGK
jgi:hypothetical protein